MKLPRRQFLRLAASTAALSAVSRIASAQVYPTRPVRIVVGFTAGSATDITARLFAQKLNEAWKTPVTVENIPGAGGSVESAPDGSTLYWGANGAMTINPSLQPSPAFDPARDLAPIARVLVMPSILAVNNEVPARVTLRPVTLDVSFRRLRMEAYGHCDIARRVGFHASSVAVALHHRQRCQRPRSACRLGRGPQLGRLPAVP